MSSLPNGVRTMLGERRECLHCGASFRLQNVMQTYCSRACSVTATKERERKRRNGERIEPYHRTCALCGAPFDTVQGATRYCQPHRQSAAIRDEPCVICGGPIKRKQTRFKLYCSQTCSSRAESQRQGCEPMQHRPNYHPPQTIKDIPKRPRFPGGRPNCPRCHARQWTAEPEWGLHAYGLEITCLSCGETPWALVPLERKRRTAS